MPTCNLNWCCYTMQEILLELEDCMETERSLFLQLHTNDEVIRLVRNNYQSMLSQRRIDLMVESTSKQAKEETGDLKCKNINYWKLIRNLVRLSNDNQNALLFITKHDPQGLQFEMVETTAGHRRMMFSHYFQENPTDTLEELMDERPDVIISDIDMSEAELLFLKFSEKKRKTLVWVQVPSLRSNHHQRIERKLNNVLSRVMAPYHKSKVYFADTLKLYRISEFLKNENG